ncbi:diacylglycerol kinase family enzyme [Roseivirga pacifica]|uniref:Diacylglycerol kinase family enzyme n=1 Tax=Roseivirga pacifica TaxID=1267423 RepID=A0A1I0R7R3_9BACT|nr:diacylglycerol kinase family protein [Roseivirga pacifica]RKQ49160.1 diacylglycerol kinase family enzyme [Roseivirga pacifica]SEW36632.1 Diacylglycerol kinase family enzyme [Roseivirga pacifica]
MSKILFVINPISGDRDKEDYIHEIDSWGESLGLSIEKWETTGEDDEKKLKKVIADAQPETVVAVGGDGTVMLCAEVVKDTDVALGILPGGSANGMATEVEVPDDIRGALAVIAQEKTVMADMLLFNGKDYGLHISDVGLNAGLVKDFEEGERRGFLGYASGVASQLLNLKTFRAELVLDDQIVEEQGHMIAFANARRYGTGAILSNQGRVDDGVFEVYVLRELSLPGLAGQFFDHLDEADSYFEVYRTKKVTVNLKDPQPFQIDGETKPESTKVTVEVLPKCLKLIVGADY